MDILWQEDEIDTALKIVIVGDGGVGKSSLIRRFCQGIFTSTYKKTIGVDFLEKVVTADNGRQVRLMLWDTAGQEEFDAITRAYYRRSLENVQYWKEKVERECGNIPMMILMNKIDLVDTALVSRYEAEDLAALLELEMFTTSAKNNVNIETVFLHIANSYFKAPVVASIKRFTYSPRVEVGGWRHNKKSHYYRDRQKRLQHQLARQDQVVQERRYLTRQTDTKPRSVQRRESRLASLSEPEDLPLEDMWEEPLHVSSFPLMLSGARYGQHNMLMGLRESCVDSPRTSLVRLNSLYYPVLQDDQEQWQSNLFSAASSPSLVHSSRSTSRSQLVSETDNDSATQFLNNPMFDSIKTKRSWGVRRKAKYSLNTTTNNTSLSSRCSIM